MSQQKDIIYDHISLWSSCLALKPGFQTVWFFSQAARQNMESLPGYPMYHSVTYLLENSNIYCVQRYIPLLLLSETACLLHGNHQSRLSYNKEKRHLSNLIMAQPDMLAFQLKDMLFCVAWVTVASNPYLRQFRLRNTSFLQSAIACVVSLRSLSSQLPIACSTIMQAAGRWTGQGGWGLETGRPRLSCEKKLKLPIWWVDLPHKPTCASTW